MDCYAQVSCFVSELDSVLRLVSDVQIADLLTGWYDIAAGSGACADGYSLFTATFLS